MPHGRMSSRSCCKVRSQKLATIGICLKNMRLQGLGVLTLVLSGMCLPAYSTESTECHSGISQLKLQESADTALPVRKGPRVQTSGRVPHVQVGVDLSHTTMLLAKVFRH